MKNLVKEGKSIILITHKLKEIMEICDRVTVIRKGKGIKTLDVRDTNQDELASLMVGTARYRSKLKREPLSRERKCLRLTA
nr:hypothetical protein P5630_11050 [Bacillus subtilis]